MKKIRISFKKFLKSFSLTELLVVIAVVTILIISAFLMFDKWLVKSRDSKRLTDVSNVRKSLEIFKIEKGKYPDPTDYGSITYSGSKTWKQGEFGLETANKMDELSTAPKDPFETYYTYSVTEDNKTYQLGVVFEDQSMLSVFKEEFMNDVFANSYDKFGSLKGRVFGNYSELTETVKTGNVCYIVSIPSIVVTDFNSFPADEDVGGDSEKFIISPDFPVNFVLDGKSNLPSSYIKELRKGNRKIKGEFGFIPSELYSGSCDFSRLLSGGSVDNKIFKEKFLEVYSGSKIDVVSGDEKDLSELNKEGVEKIVSFNLNKATRGGYSVEMDETPENIEFDSISGDSDNSSISSSIKQIKDIGGKVNVSIFGQGQPEYRICKDKNCDNLIKDWSDNDFHIYNRDYVQLRITEIGANTENYSVNIDIGNSSFDRAVEILDLCGVDKYDDGGCKDVGIGYYSPDNDNNRYSCTGLPSDGTHWTSSGGGSDNCDRECDDGYNRDDTQEKCIMPDPNTFIEPRKNGLKIATFGGDGDTTWNQRCKEQGYDKYIDVGYSDYDTANPCVGNENGRGTFTSRRFGRYCNFATVDQITCATE